MSTPPVIFSVRVQSQVADANLGTKGLNALFGVLNPIRVTSLEIALLGDGSGAECILNIDMRVVGVRSAPTRSELAAMTAWARNAVRSSKAARALPATMFGVPTIDLLAAVFLYTAENPYPLYSCITAPLNVSGTRTLQSLQQQLPFMKLFTLGLLSLSTAGYRFKGALYRGVDVSRSAAFQAKYDSHATAYQVGTTITFVAPTSFSTSDHAAGSFTKGIQFVVPDGDGVSLDDVSAFDEESEVVVNGPSSWEVAAATMTPTGTLVVVIKRLPDFVSFLTSPGDANAPAPAAAATSSASIAPSASAATASSSTSSSAAVDPSLQPLTDALVALKIGTHKTCSAFAESLGQKGVMSIDDLQLLSQAKVRDLLGRLGFEELQQLKLMQAVAPPLSSVSFSAIASSSPLSRPLQCEWAALKNDGYTARELRPAGCDFLTARDVGFDLPSLKAAGYDLAAFRAAGCSWADVKTAGFTAAEAKAAGCDLAAAKAAGFDLPSLKAGGYDLAAFRAAGCSWADVKTAGFTVAEVKAAGCDLAAAKAAGFDLPSLKAVD